VGKQEACEAKLAEALQQAKTATQRGARAARLDTRNASKPPTPDSEKRPRPSRALQARYHTRPRKVARRLLTCVFPPGADPSPSAAQTESTRAHSPPLTATEHTVHAPQEPASKFSSPPATQHCAAEPARATAASPPASTPALAIRPQNSSAVLAPAVTSPLVAKGMQGAALTRTLQATRPTPRDRPEAG
jgi:hypothetical protein